jgi:hypothetical protein
MAALSPEEKQKMLIILTLLSQGQAGRNTLAALQPLLQMWEQKQADAKARKDAKRAQWNGIASQAGSIGGQLGGMYLIGKALAPAAATAPVAAAAAPAVATPTLLGAKTVSLGGSSAASGGTTLGSVGSVALPVAVGALALNNLWEGGGKDILRGRGDRADWANTAFNTAPLTAGALLGPAAVPFAAALPIANLGLRLLGKRSIGQMMNTGKSDAQMMRDDFRGMLKEKGIVDKDYNVTLANGQKFNLGLDGKTKYTNADGKTTRNAYDVDLNDPLSMYAVSKIDPYIRKMYGAGDPKNGLNPEQYTAMMVNAVRSGAKTEAEIDANINSVLGTKPFEGNAPVRPTAATPPQGNQPAPQAPTVSAGPAPAPAQAPAAPAPLPAAAPQRLSIQDVLRPPAPQAAPAAAPAPAPTPAPAPAPQQNVAPATRPPAPMPSSVSGPLPMTPPPQAKQAGAQGLLSLKDQLSQQGGDMDLNGILNMLKNLQQQGGVKS